MMEAGRIVNTHGLRGEVKIEPWCDAAEKLSRVPEFYIDGVPVAVRAACVHKNCVLAQLENVETVEAAMALRGKVVWARRSHFPLSEGQYFVADLVGLGVFDARTGERIGRLEEVLSYPASDVYVVRGAREYLIPAVSAFIKKIDLAAGRMEVAVQEGLATDEN